MGLVVVISLPFILFCFFLGVGCYFLGRHRGRQEARGQVFGTPVPPPGAAGASFPSSPIPPPPHHAKDDNSANV